MFEEIKMKIENSRKRFYGFDKKAFIEKQSSDITNYLANGVHMPIVAQVKRTAIERRIPDGDAIKIVVENLLVERMQREKGKFESTVKEVQKECELLSKQVETMKSELGLLFDSGAKCKEIGNDAFSQVEQILMEWETLSAIMPYKDTVFELRMRIGCKTYKKGGN